MANSFSAQQFRKKALLCQGLLRRGSFGRGTSAVLKCIQQLGYVQIDTISVVERAHNHVLWSRVPGYLPQMLDKLVKRKKIFEYWSHAAAYLPMDDFRYALPRMQAIKSGEKHWFANKDRKLMRRICQRIAVEGPLMARDFEDTPRSKSGWWDWKPTKQALEQLFMEGDLMVVGRQGFQKIYDLTERALPPALNTTLPDLHEQAAYLIDTTIRAHGFATLKSFTYLRKGKAIREGVKEQLHQLVADGRLTETSLPCGTPVFADTHLASKKRVSDEVAILSPFDNSVIQRERGKKVFDFDYQIECYVPAAKRQFGYFCLPLLYGDQFVGRMDCKADRKENVLRVKALHTPAKQSAAFFQALANALEQYADFNQCEHMAIECGTASAKRLAGCSVVTG
ncbi:MAG: crosslink repair DNA glycosylase YcaQ family protein [Pseudomonadota bacterium]